MQPMNRPGILGTGRQMMDNSVIANTPLFRIIKMFVACYTAVQDFMLWARILRSGGKPLNELTVEGFYAKELEVFYFDFFDHKDWERTKDTLRCMVTAVVLSILFYLLATYLMDLDLRLRVIATCILSTLLTLLLSYSPASRAVTYLMIPSMARGSLRNAILLGAIVLLAAGPANNLRSNMDAISTSKSCLHGQFLDVVGLVKSLYGKNLVNLLMIPVRLIVSAVQMVAEILYRMVFAVYVTLQKMMDTMKRLFKQLGRMLASIRSLLSFHGSCLQMTRSLALRFRRTRLLGGLLQMIIAITNLFRSVSQTPPLAKPTVGHIIYEVGNNKVCPLLEKAKAIYNAKKRQLSAWFDTHVMKHVNEILAVRDLINDAIGPDTKVTIAMSGGIGHQLREMKAMMRRAVQARTIEVKESFRFASQVVQVVSSALSLLIFGVTLLLAINFYRMYMQADDFENNYVTAPFLRLEEIEPPILPLDAYEKTRVAILADAMISDIVRRLGSSDLLFAVLRLLPFIIVMLLEWIMYMMAYFLESTWNRVIEVERNLDTRLTLTSAHKNAAETNPMVLLLSVVIQVQKALREINLDINVLACSPRATKPNWALDIVLCLLLLLYTALTLFGPFFLKLRHHIMLDLAPARAVQRAVWLRREIEADRQLLPTDRHLLKLPQDEQESSMQYLFNTYVREGLDQWVDMLRSLFNLPTIRCACCGIRGSLSMKNFNDFFTVCDSCESSVCAPCAHYTDQDGAVRLREKCPSCGLKMEDVEIDAEEMEEEDPLNEMLYNFLDLTPGYKVSRSALTAQLAEAAAFQAAKAKEEERSFMAVLGPDALVDPKVTK